jgi:hypothetical protein
VRGPKHVVKTGKTPVLEGEEWRKLLGSIPAASLRDLRDRALIATLTYSFARINAALKMKIEDLRPRSAGWNSERLIAKISASSDWQWSAMFHVARGNRPRHLT